MSQGRSRSNRSAQGGIMRWLKRDRPPSPSTRLPEKRAKVSSKCVSQSRDRDIANAVDSREGLHLLWMDDFAQRMFTVSNAEVRKCKGVG